MTAPDQPNNQPALTAQQCADWAGEALTRAVAAANRGNTKAADALVSAADGWRQLGETIARHPAMGPQLDGDDQ